MAPPTLPPVYQPATYNARLLPFKDYYPADGLFHSYLWWAGEVVYATPMFHLGAILPAVCHEATRRGYRLAVSGDPIRLWACLIGGSGSGKSTAHKMGVQFYTSVRQHLQPIDFRTPFMHLGGSIQGVKHALVTDHREAQIDRVVAILETDELTRFLPRRQGSVTEDLCQMFDGRALTDHTRTAQRAQQQGILAHQSLEDYTLSALFATTPAALDDSTSETYFTGGLFSRIFWVTGRVDPSSWTPGLIDWQDVRRATAIDRWKQWSAWADGYEMTGGKRVIHLPDDARAVYDAFVDKYRDRCFDEEGGRWAPMYMRGVSDHVIRIAAAYAFSCEDAFDLIGHSGVYISPDDMSAAVRMVEQCFLTFDKLAVTVAVESRTKLHEKLRDQIIKAGKKGASRTDLWHACNVNERPDFPAALEALLAGEGVFRVTPRSKRQGRPPTYYYAIQHLDAVQAYWADVEQKAAAAATAAATASSSGRVVSMRRRGNVVATVEEPSSDVGTGEADTDVEQG